MKVNYHTHTTRCHHAFGTEEQYIQNAIAASFDELGFADHTPWHYDDPNYHGNARMEEDKLEDYTTTIHALQEKYQDQIKIYLGLEVEYFEEKLPWLLEKKKELGIDYFILGHHYHISDEINSYNGIPTRSKERFLNFVEDEIKAIQSGLFLYIAHPDLINYQPSNSEFYQEQMTRVILAAKKYNIPLEFNLLGFNEQRNYPNPVFWQLVSQHQAKAIIGFDAHTPETLLNTELYERARKYLSDLHIEIVESIKIK